MEGFCIECGAKLSGRSDKKFCNDYCRATYHNNLYRKRANEQNAVNSILRNNYRVLSAMVSSGRRELSRESLAAERFNPDYCTGSRKGFLGRRIYSCYSLSYCLTPSGGLMVVE